MHGPWAGHGRPSVVPCVAVHMPDPRASAVAFPSARSDTLSPFSSAGRTDPNGVPVPGHWQRVGRLAWGDCLRDSSLPASVGFPPAEQAGAGWPAAGERTPNGSLAGRNTGATPLLSWPRAATSCWRRRGRPPTAAGSGASCPNRQRPAGGRRRVASRVHRRGLRSSAAFVRRSASHRGCCPPCRPAPAAHARGQTVGLNDPCARRQPVARRPKQSRCSQPHPDGERSCGLCPI